jgi:hypothetical protein
MLLEQGYLFAAFNGVNRFYLRADLRDQLERLQVPVNVLDNYSRAETVFLREHVGQLERRLRELEARASPRPEAGTTARR